MSTNSAPLPALAAFGEVTARNLVDLTHDPEALDSAGRWVVCVTFEGEVTCARFADWDRESPSASELGRWHAPAQADWVSSQSRADFTQGVDNIRAAIARGDVYQVNLCRQLSARLPDVHAADIAALAQRLAVGNPAAFGGFIRVRGVHVATASPELFLSRRGQEIVTGPIKGTGASAADISGKDHAENIMIVDLMRNDFGRICLPGSIDVPLLLGMEDHPGLVHLVSRVSGQLRSHMRWAEILAALTPAGSVSGAPKLAALNIIDSLEGQPRGPYCGVLGWVDADRQEAELAVGIRTFWKSHDQVHFGTGAGITWGSDPQAEWDETELKSRHLLSVASGEPVETSARMGMWQ